MSLSNIRVFSLFALMFAGSALQTKHSEGRMTTKLMQISLLSGVLSGIAVGFGQLLTSLWVKMIS